MYVLWMFAITQKIIASAFTNLGQTQFAVCEPCCQSPTHEKKTKKTNKQTSTNNGVKIPRMQTTRNANSPTQRCCSALCM
jgi:hypothetical protein